jgi:microcystin-dependent protein
VRTTNASYWQVLTAGPAAIVTTGTTNSTINVTAIPSTAGMTVGMLITGAGIPANTTIASIVSGTAITLSVAATASATGVAITATTAVMFLRSNSVPDTDSLFSAEIQGNVGVTGVRFSQDIQGDLAATLRNPCTFSGYLYNNTGATLSPQLIISSANAFNNFATRTDVSTTSLQSCPNGQWTYVTDTVDLTSLSNIANGFSVVVSFSGMAASADYVLFSRLKFQSGTVATPFTDDVSLFVQTPSVDSTMLQDGCIARPTLFLPNVVPLGAYVDKSITDPKIADHTILARSLSAGTIVTTGNTNSTINVTGIPDTTGMLAAQAISGAGIPAGTTIASVVSGTAITLSAAATTTVTGVTLTVVSGISATVGNLGYTPINKAGDSGIGPGPLNFLNDTVVGASAYTQAAAKIGISSTNASNDGYMPAIGFGRPGVNGRALGLSTTNRFKTVDNTGTVGYLLDTVTGVDTNSYQSASITFAKLATSLTNLICPVGMIMMFSGYSPPTGWLLCDGSPQSRTTYSALWAAIGTAWGAGDGASTFNLPNLQGRAPIGYVTNAGLAPGITARTFGVNTATYGEENHALAVSELAAHAHGINQTAHNHTLHDPGHQHSYVNPIGATGAQGGAVAYTASGTAQTGSSIANVSMDPASITISLQNTGSGTGHNTMMPFAIVYYIVKY